MRQTAVSASLGLLLLASCATTSNSNERGRDGMRLEYDSAQLLMKNSDQMNDLIKEKLQIAENAQAAVRSNLGDGVTVAPEAIEALTDAMRLTLARPDHDGNREALFSRLRRELIDLNSIESVLNSLTQESIDAIRGENSPKVQATYITILENMMAEIKPEVPRSEPMKRIVESIRDANLKVPDEVQGQQRLHTMKRFVSPSETAEKIVPRKKKK